MDTKPILAELLDPLAEAGPQAPTAMVDLVRGLLEQLGVDPAEGGLRSTPERVARTLRFLTSGYLMDPQEVFHGAVYEVVYDEMVIVKDIEVFSLCEHHLLPFYGKAHVAYIPNRKVVGLSKIPRLVDMFARRLQIQERLTNQIAETLQQVMDPRGVGVVIEARHFCIMMRGVEKQHSSAVTSAMLGAFRTNKQTRDEFLSLISHKGNGF